MKTIQKYKGSHQRNSLWISLIFLFLIGTTFSISSCKKFIDIPPPSSQLVTTNVFTNNATATSAQIAIYTTMWTDAESFYMAQNMGLYADELQNYDSDPYSKQVYTNTLAASETSWGAHYATTGDIYYNYIYDANAVISNLKSTTGCSPAVKKQLTGEAYFVRAFWQFYLTNIFGAVPLVLTTNYATNGTLVRTPRVQVLQQVIADLETAKSLLNANYVDGSDTLSTTERVRPTKAAAEALLARAYLYLGDYSNSAASYQKADSAATELINNPTYSLDSLSDVFLKNSSEAIWQLQTPGHSEGFDTPDGAYFILLGAPSTSSGANSSTISSQLMGSFEPGDHRKTSWIGSIIESANTYYFPYKYKNYLYQGTEYVMVLRLGEQYLIRAEARVHEGNIIGANGALSDLDMIRNRAGLPNYAGAQDPASVLTAILHERQVELFAEWGSRWFDLCRAIHTQSTVNANTVMGPGSGPDENVCQYKGGTWNSNDYQLLWPIPQKDIGADPKLTQNPGY